MLPWSHHFIQLLTCQTLVVGMLVVTSSLGWSANLSKDPGQVDRVDIMRRANRSTVEIEAHQLHANAKTRSSGSGVILSTSGIIVTAYHVVAEHDQITVRTSSGASSADLIAFDDEYDIAILRIKRSSALEAASVASAKRITPGRAALVIGNPLGRGQTALTGRLGVTRMVHWAGHHAELVALHADVLPGNSGGGAFDLETGELLGITIAKSSTQEGTGYVVPAERIADFVQSRARISEWETAQSVDQQLGMHLRPVKIRGGRFQEGMLVTDVHASSAAAAAGVKSGDVLVGLDRYRTQSFDDVLFAVEGASVRSEQISYLVARHQSLERGTLAMGSIRRHQPDSSFVAIAAPVPRR